LALAVLANALNVMESGDEYDAEPEDTNKKIAARGADSPSAIAKSFMNDAKGITKLEILSTLISELGKAANTPHNACLSAKCLHSLFRASKDARRRARELGAKNVVNTALDVGVRTHAKLETECKNVAKVLAETMDDDHQEE
jgi:predicted phage gp36 major capsid-like protein